MSNSFSGFWSYVHDDDQTEGKRITTLAHKLVAEYEMVTGDTIELFLDKDGISWGEKWRDKIDATLASVAFFIPVMTPRYFMRPHCRAELERWIRRTNQRGLRGLLLPLHYINVPSFDEEHTKDILIRTIREYQWADWRTLRFEEVDSPVYRRAVFNLVERLVEANKKAEEASFREARVEPVQPAGGDSPEPLGTIDRMAKLEQESPKWKKTIDDLAHQIEIFNSKMEKATSDLNRGDARERISQRLPIVRRLARELDEPSNQISILANQYVSQLHDVDDGLRALIGEIPEQVKNNPEFHADVCNFFMHIRVLSATAKQAFINVDKWIDAMLPVERMSRDLRPRLRRLRQALTTMVEAREVTDGWVNMMDATGVDCSQ